MIKVESSCFIRENVSHEKIRGDALLYVSFIGYKKKWTSLIHLQLEFESIEMSLCNLTWWWIWAGKYRHKSHFSNECSKKWLFRVKKCCQMFIKPQIFIDPNGFAVGNVRFVATCKWYNYYLLLKTREMLLEARLKVQIVQKLASSNYHSKSV